MTVPIYVFFAQEEVGLTVGQVGAIGGAFYFAQFFGCFVYGRMADAYGRKPVHIVAMVWSALVYIMFYFVDNFWMFFFCRFLGGLAGPMNASKIFVSSIAADRTEDAKQDGDNKRHVETLATQTGRALAFAESLGMFVAPLIVAVAIGPLHFNRRWIFGTASFLCGLAGLVCWTFVEESLPVEKRRAFRLGIEDGVSMKATQAGFANWWAEWASFVPMLAATFLLGVTIDGFFIAYPGLLKSRFGMGDVVFSLILSSFSAIGFFVRSFGYPRLVKIGFEPKACAMLACGLNAFGGLAIVLSPYFTQHLLGCLSTDFGLSMFFVALPTLVSVMAPEGLLATAQASTQAALSLGSVVGVFFGGQLADWQIEAPIVGGAILGVIAMGFFMSLQTKDQQKERDLLLGKKQVTV